MGKKLLNHRPIETKRWAGNPACGAMSGDIGLENYVAILLMVYSSLIHARGARFGGAIFKR